MSSIPEGHADWNELPLRELSEAAQARHLIVFAAFAGGKATITLTDSEVTLGEREARAFLINLLRSYTSPDRDPSE